MISAKIYLLIADIQTILLIIEEKLNAQMLLVLQDDLTDDLNKDDIEIYNLKHKQF